MNNFITTNQLNPEQQTAVNLALANGQTCLADLGYQGLLAVEGPDAAKFLQGQVTCDIQELAQGVSRLGAQCTIKGRMLVSFRSLQLNAETIFLRMHKGLISHATTSFGKYIVFSKAKLHDRSDNYQRIGLYGPQAEELVNQFALAPDSLDRWNESDGNIVIKLDQQRYECWLLPEKAEAICEMLVPRCTLADQNLWTLLDIRAGIGEVRPESHEMFTPQALNYQLVNAINFRKGCYTGQEIVARLHYRGTLKSHMYRVSFSTEQIAALPLPGAAVFTAEKKNIGEVVMCAYSSATTAEALAVISDNDIESAFVNTDQPKKLEPQPLPYAIPTEGKD